MEHIVTGYDHLLFLAALLLTVRTFKEAAAIITCFTVAHSITLVAGGAGHRAAAGGVVEPAIALSIVYVGLRESLRHARPLAAGRDDVLLRPGARAGLRVGAAGIGLGHDSRRRRDAAAEVQHRRRSRATGRRRGVAAAAAGRASQRATSNKRLVPVGSVAVALMGGYWFVTRVLDQSSGLSSSEH